MERVADQEEGGIEADGRRFGHIRLTREHLIC
jgi:hypothetical protein